MQVVSIYYLHSQLTQENIMGSHNQITYEYFCVLGGLANHKCAKRHLYNGSYYYNTYHYID